LGLEHDRELRNLGLVHGRARLLAKGTAETPDVATALATLDAICDAIEARVKALPVNPERVLKVLREVDAPLRSLNRGPES